MKKRLRVLHVEDEVLDATMMARVFQMAGYEVEWTRADTQAAYESALDSLPQVVIADYQLPQFSGLRALEILKQRALDIPFILVSGTVGEEKAAEAIRLGADDYPLKDRLARLPSAVERALERLADKRAAAEAEAGLRRAQDMAKLAHVVTAPDGAFESWSESLPQLIGSDAASLPLTTREWLQIMHPQDRARFRARALEAAKSRGRSDVEYRVQRADGGSIHIRQTMEPLGAEPGPSRRVRWFHTLQNITEMVEKAQRLDYLSYYDQLTGLPNRTLFHERLKLQLQEAARAQGRIALLILDIEHFKTINDTLGPEGGDALLKEVATRLEQGLYPGSWVARIGADQFAIVVPALATEEELGRRIEEHFGGAFSAPFEVAGTEWRLSARMGIALCPHDGTDADILFRNAEAALKKAKATGERYLFYMQAMTARVAERLSLENKLRQALEKEQFVLHYQPKVERLDRRIVGVEALIRWQSPELGLVPPGSFISLLEETGLILAVGSWALQRAARDHRAWVEQGLKAPRVAVNVSQVQFRQRDFVSVVEQAVLDGVAPTAIDLEITESLAMQDVQGTIEKLKAARALGIKVAIDDFGTGYSSLAHLAKLPVETLKIDRAFIHGMLDDPNTATLVHTIISLAHSLRLKVVAEGVETEAQAGVLRLLRCDEMQGYLFSKPLPLEQVTALLRAKGLE